MESGKVDGQRLCITGRSAGGYATLAALAFRDTFKAGASLYGVSFRFLESTIVFAINIRQIFVFILFLLSTCIYSILAEQFTIYPLNPFVQVSDTLFSALMCPWSYNFFFECSQGYNFH